MTDDKVTFKIGTKEEKFWSDVLDKCKIGIDNARHEIEINEYLLRLAEEKIQQEKTKSLNT